MENLICSRRIQVPTFLIQDLVIPELKGLDLSSLEVRSDNGNKSHEIKKARGVNTFTFKFRDIPPNEIVLLSIFQVDHNTAVESAKPVKNEVAVKPDYAAPAGSDGKKKPFFHKFQNRQKKRVALNQSRIDEIRDKNLDHSNLSGAKILTFDFCGCWARALGMIQKTKQLQFQLKKPLYDCFDRITGQGDGAIIAAVAAAGIDFDRLYEWWTSDWKKVHAPGKIKQLGRWAKSKVKPNESGYDAKKARKALKKLFTKAGADMRMKDVLTMLQITVMQADMNVSTHYSQNSPNLELYAAVEDSAITKMHYNQKETIKGEAVFLGAIEKNDVAGLALSRDNKNMSITSIGAPTRVNPKTARQLTKLGHSADKTALQTAGHFMNEKRVGQLIKKLAEAGYKVSCTRLECAAIDGVVCNSTDDRAMRAGIESGSGQITMIQPN